MAWRKKRRSHHQADREETAAIESVPHFVDRISHTFARLDVQVCFLDMFANAATLDEKALMPGGEPMTMAAFARLHGNKEALSVLASRGAGRI